MVDIRGSEEVEVEEDQREVRKKLFATIVECQDTTHGSVRTRCSYSVNIVLSLTMRQKTALY